jgi:hypothetical protein
VFVSRQFKDTASLKPIIGEHSMENMGDCGIKGSCTIGFYSGGSINSPHRPKDIFLGKRNFDSKNRNTVFSEDKSYEFIGHGE